MGLGSVKLGSDVQETREKAGQKESAHGHIGDMPGARITGGSTSRNFLDSAVGGLHTAAQ